jgi:hypothetical protein
VSDNRVISLLALFFYRRNDGVGASVVGFFFGVYLFYRGFRLLQRKRLILNTPTSKIRSASMGLVEINGLAVGPYTMTAPITGVPCYYFRSIAWQWQNVGRNSKWVKVADESLHLPFFLDDNTGRVLVDPQGAEMDIHRDFHEQFGTSLFSTSFEIPSNISGFLACHGVSTDKKLKIEEYCIKPKNALFILGTLAQNPGLTVSPAPVRSLTSEEHTVSLQLPKMTGLGFSLTAGTGRAASTSFAAFQSEPAQPQMHLVGTSNPAQTTSVTDPGTITAALVKAGITSPAAWAAAGVVNSVGVATPASASTGAASRPALEQFDLHPPVVLKRGTHDPAFLISWHSQRDVVGTLSWKSALLIWGGPALTLLCAYFLAAHFDWL